MKKIRQNDCDIYGWAWEQRKQKIPPDEGKYSISEAVNILKEYSDPDTTQKKLRDYEKEGVIVPERTEGSHRLYSVSDILSLHLMLHGTKYFGKTNTKPIVALYQLSRRQPTRHNPTIFDYDPSLPREENICEVLHKPLIESPIRQVGQIIRIVDRIHTFLHINDFARKHNIGFRCFDDELIEVKRAGMTLKITPPLIEWRSVKKAIYWKQYYWAEAKINDNFPEEEKEIQEFEKEINKKIIDWLVNNEYAVKL